MNSDIIDEIKDIISPVLKEEGIELVELNYSKLGGQIILRLLVDKHEGGISLGECASLNVRIGSILEEQDLIKNKYTLEVSSPGLDRPLVNRADFLRCMNRNIRLFLREPQAGKTELTGRISKVTEDSVFIDAKVGTLEINFNSIVKAKQILEEI